MADNHEQAVTQEGTQMPDLLWVKGPTTAMLDEWKSRFKRVYLANFEDDDRYVFRSITRDEFKSLKGIKGADQFYIEERMCERCCLWPPMINFQAMAAQKAGVPSELTNLIMEKSGFTTQEVDLMETWMPIDEEFTEEFYLDLKKKYGRLYVVEFDEGSVFVFRSLTRKEYKDMQKEEGDSMYQEEKTCEKCVVYPKDYNFTAMRKAPAGIPTTMAELIMLKSGFTATSVQVLE